MRSGGAKPPRDTLVRVSHSPRGFLGSLNSSSGCYWASCEQIFRKVRLREGSWLEQKWKHQKAKGPSWVIGSNTLQWKHCLKMKSKSKCLLWALGGVCRNLVLNSTPFLIVFTVAVRSPCLFLTHVPWILLCGSVPLMSPPIRLPASGIWQQDPTLCRSHPGRAGELVSCPCSTYCYVTSEQMTPPLWALVSFFVKEVGKADSFPEMTHYR